MKKFFCILIATLFISFVVSPGIDMVKANDAIDSNLKLDGFELIFEGKDHTIFQLTNDDGEIYEYVEKVVNKQGLDIIEQEVYKIDKTNKEKLLIETNKIEVRDESDGIVIKDLNDEHTEEIKIFNDGTTSVVEVDDSPQIGTLAVKKQTASGGSYIADIRWIEYSDKSATAINGKKYKYTKTNVWQYRDFRAAASSIKTSEVAFATAGISTVVDAVVAHWRKGNMISWELIKKVGKALGKGTLGVGTIASIAAYINTCKNAVTAFNKIPK